MATTVKPTYKHKCSLCDASFLRASALEIHQKCHVNEKSDDTPLKDVELPVKTVITTVPTSKVVSKHKCTLCDITFLRSSALEIHMKSKHANGNKCDDKLLKDTVQSPQSVSTGIKNIIISPHAKHKCTLCDSSFLRLSALAIHRRTKHDQEYSFSKDSEKSTVKKKRTQPRVENQIELVQVNIKMEPNDFDDECFNCPQCDKSFDTFKTLAKHIKAHSQVRHKCEYCEKSFLQNDSKVKHEKRHQGSNLVKCKICDVPYAEQRDLDSHMKKHDVTKPFKCDYCDKTFAEFCDKKQHMRIHTGDCPFKCEVCAKTFINLTKYKAHQIAHSGVRKFQCTICGKSYQNSSNLTVHNRSHTGERPYKCEICDKTFIIAFHYKVHMDTHNNRQYKCPICEKEFLHHSSFVRHKKVHSGVKTHECKVCGKRFSQSTHYNNHMRIHTGERPFPCEICDKSFSRLDRVKLHMKTHMEKTRKPRRKKVNTELESQVEMIQQTPIPIPTSKTSLSPPNKTTVITSVSGCSTTIIKTGNNSNNGDYTELVSSKIKSIIKTTTTTTGDYTELETLSIRPPTMMMEFEKWVHGRVVDGSQIQPPPPSFPSGTLHHQNMSLNYQSNDNNFQCYNNPNYMQ